MECKGQLGMTDLAVSIPTKIHCIHFVSMNLANMSSLQMWPVLDAVSLYELAHKAGFCMAWVISFASLISM